MIFIVRYRDGFLMGQLDDIDERTMQLIAGSLLYMTRPFGGLYRGRSISIPSAEQIELLNSGGIIVDAVENGGFKGFDLAEVVKVELFDAYLREDTV